MIQKKKKSSKTDEKKTTYEKKESIMHHGSQVSIHMKNRNSLQISMSTREKP